MQYVIILIWRLCIDACEGGQFTKAPTPFNVGTLGRMSHLVQALSSGVRREKFKAKIQKTT